MAKQTSRPVVYVLRERLAHAEAVFDETLENVGLAFTEKKLCEAALAAVEDVTAELEAEQKQLVT